MKSKRPIHFLHSTYFTMNGTIAQIAWSCLSQPRAATSSVCRVSCDRTRSCLRATTAYYWARFPATPTGNLKGIRNISSIQRPLWNEAFQVFQSTSEQKLSEMLCRLFASVKLTQAVVIFSKLIGNNFNVEFNLHEKKFFEIAPLVKTLKLPQRQLFIQFERDRYFPLNSYAWIHKKMLIKFQTKEIRFVFLKFGFSQNFECAHSFERCKFFNYMRFGSNDSLFEKQATWSMPRAGLGNWRRGAHVTRHSVLVARGSIQEQSTNLKFPPTYHRKC